MTNCHCCQGDLSQANGPKHVQRMNYAIFVCDISLHVDSFCSINQFNMQLRTNGNESPVLYDKAWPNRADGNVSQLHLSLSLDHWSVSMCVCVVHACYKWKNSFSSIAAFSITIYNPSDGYLCWNVHRLTDTDLVTPHTIVQFRNDARQEKKKESIRSMHKKMREKHIFFFPRMKA